MKEVDILEVSEGSLSDFNDRINNLISRDYRFHGYSSRALQPNYTREPTWKYVQFMIKETENEQ